MIRRLDEHVSVAPQIAPTDLEELAAHGFRHVVNNRPDGEDIDQPPSAEIAAAAAACGMDYSEVPITHAGLSHAQVDRMAALLQHADGPVLAFCRSGTRSCYVWALARAKLGDEPDLLEEKASAAGYDLSPLRPMMDVLRPR